MSRVLALDQSSKVSGFAVFEDTKLIDYGTFSFASNKLDRRLKAIREKVAELITKYSIDEVIIENIQYQEKTGNIETFKVLAEVFGVVNELLEELCIPHSSVCATSWRAELNMPAKGLRATQKKAAQDYVLKKFDIQASDDVCDAICIGQYHVLEHLNDWSD